MSNDECLESELIRIVQEGQRPLNLEEIFSYLYDRRDKLSELSAANKETILEKRRVKRFLDRSTQQGRLLASWENGETFYQASSPAASLKISSFRLSIIRVHDKLFNVFCLVALTVLAIVIGFLFFNWNFN